MNDRLKELEKFRETLDTGCLYVVEGSNYSSVYPSAMSFKDLAELQGLPKDVLNERKVTLSGGKILLT